MRDDFSTPADLQEAVLGPVDVAVTGDSVSFYVTVTGDSPERWTDVAPPGFASVPLFAVADLFLYHPKVVPFTATLLHVDQAFTYISPMRIGSTITTTGVITRVRERGGSYFVAFEAVGVDGSIDVFRSESTFILSDIRAPAAESAIDEPPVRHRGANGGEARSASRHDLVRYAAATRDFNPLHWDHEVAVASGLSGTVVHGLLMYAWMMQAVADAAGGADISESKIRFRSALHPGQQATLSTVRNEDTVKVELLRGERQLVTGTATVARTTE